MELGRELYGGWPDHYSKDLSGWIAHKPKRLGDCLWCAWSSGTTPKVG